MNRKDNTLNRKDHVRPLKPLSAPKIDDENVVVEIENEEYQHGVKALRFSVV